MAAKTSALQQAIQGKDLSEKQAKGALSQAVTRIANLSKKADQSRAALAATGTQVVHVAETQGSLFLSSMAEGYLGSEKLKVGGVDVRAPVGIATTGYGLYQTLSGEAGGGHALALGSGVLGSWLASAAVEAGKSLAERKVQPKATHPQQPAYNASIQGGWAHPAAPVPAPTPSSHTVQQAQHALMPAPQLQLSGPLREVHLTPAAESLDGALQRADRRHDRRESRFPTAMPLNADEPA